jgi:hypothetical protein
MKIEKKCVSWGFTAHHQYIDCALFEQMSESSLDKGEVKKNVV